MLAFSLLPKDSIPAPAWPIAQVLLRLGMATAMGAFVGLEREHRQKEGGLRTFILASILGCLGGMMGQSYSIAALAFAALAAFWLNHSQMLAEKRPALTTSMALALTCVVGILFGRGQVFAPGVAGIVTAAFLSWKEPLARFAGILSAQEVRSAVLLAILSFVLLPALPSHPVDRWGLIEPRTYGATVVLVAGIGFFNYVLLRAFGPRGMELTAIFGGLVNTKQVMVELGMRLRQIGEAALPSVYAGTVLAVGAMVLRNSLVVAILAPKAFGYCAGPLALIMISAAGAWFLFHRLARRKSAGPALRMEKPFKLGSVLEFGILFMVLKLLGGIAQKHFGTGSFLLVSALGGVFSSASSAAAAAALLHRHAVPLAAGVYGVIFSSLASVLANIPLIRGLSPHRDFKRRITWTLAAIAAVGAAGAGLNFLLLRAALQRASF